MDSYDLKLIRLLTEIAGQHSPWSKPFKEGDDVWTRNEYMSIPPERQVVSREADVNATCSSLFGQHSGGLWGGCVTYTPEDESGLWSTTYLPRKGGRGIAEHESMHAKGLVHPWPGFNKQQEKLYER